MPALLRSTLGRAVGRVNGAYDRFCNPDRTTLISLEQPGPSRGRALIAHVVEGYLAASDDAVRKLHNHHIEGRLLPRILFDLGYSVDYISWRNRRFVPKQRYDLFIGPRDHFEEIASRLNPDCIRIVHLDTMHWLYNNHAALTRQRDLQARRGVAISSYKQIMPNRAIETAHCGTILGNGNTYGSYAFAGKRLYQIPNPSGLRFGPPSGKDFEACRRRFLWLGSAGLVHKGLDVTLEAFARMPDVHLTVCGPVADDPDFERTYRRELYETPNITTQGWTDVTSDTFREIAAQCVGVVNPSAAEACCGSVVNAMQAGLIPIASEQTGIDLGPGTGVVLDEISVPAIERSVRWLSSQTPDVLRSMARTVWQEAQSTYTPEGYRAAFAASIEAIVAAYPRLDPGFVPLREPSPVPRLRRA